MRRALRQPLTFLIATCLLACTGGNSTDGEEAGPVILIGIDGGSWNAIQTLIERNELPNLRAMMERGVTAELKPVAAASPVIWTSMATGVRPERHGITNFVVPTDTGDVPVSSQARRVPAIWNMVSVVDRRVAALGWWASWPAETVNGVVVSDRVVRNLDRSVWPPEFAPTFDSILDQTRKSQDDSITRNIGIQDRALAAAAQSLVADEFDLMLLYLRNVDVQSHPYWKYFQPEAFAEIDPDRLAQYADRVPEAYREVDRVLGELVAAADPRTNFFVVSDHGFRPLRKGQHRIVLDLDRVLEHLGYLRRDASGIDWQRTEAATWDTPEAVKLKLVRFGLVDRSPPGPVAPDSSDVLFERLAADLARVTYETGEPVFLVREPRPKEAARGGDMTVVVQHRGVSNLLRVGDDTIRGAVRGIHELTGTHDANTEGVFLAAGPDIDPAASVERVHSLDITPTLLYAMALPVAQDFDGRPRIELFRGEFRRRHPVRTLPSWGTRDPMAAPTSEADAELMEELRALGYLN